MEFLNFQSLQRTLSHNKEIFVLFQFTHKTVIIGKIFRDLTVYQCNEKRSSHIFYALQSLLIIVQISQGNYEFIVLIGLNVIFQFCLIIKIHGNQTGSLRKIGEKPG